MKKIFSVLNNLSQYLVLSFSLTLLLLFVYFLQVGSPENVAEFIYSISIPFYYYYILLVLSIVLLPFLFLKHLRYIVIIPKVLLDVFLLADIFVFRIYRFHIDMMFVNMAIHDFRGIGLSNTMVFLAVVSFLIIVLFNIWILNKATKKQLFKIGKLSISLFVILLLGQIIHIWAYEYKQQFITKYTPYFPYYFPTTSHSLMTKINDNYPRIIPKPIEKPVENNKALFNDNKTSGTFNYPKKPVQINDTTPKPNILFLLAESWRFDMLHKEITPNIFKIIESGYQFNNHYSCGSVTVSGLFSLLYGLHPSYLKYAQADPYKYQSVLTKSLEKSGYDISVYTPSNLDRFSLKPMLFGKIEDENYYNQRSLSTVKNDMFVVSKLIEDIKESKAKPWFKFLFLDSSHHSYKYPKEHTIFTPLPENPEGFVFDKNIDPTPFLNDYKNSIHYVDALFGEVFDAIEQVGIDKNTLIIISSDHGEEFNDNKTGYWGHGSNFTSYQTSVPLIIKLPNNNQHVEIDKLSGHIDIVPTILNHVLKSENKISDYSSGYNLFDLPDDRGLIMASYKDNAFLIENMIYANGLFFKSYDVHDEKKENKDIAYDKINLLRKEETYFLE